MMPTSYSSTDGPGQIQSGNEGPSEAVQVGRVPEQVEAQIAAVLEAVFETLSQIDKLADVLVAYGPTQKTQDGRESIFGLARSGCQSREESSDRCGHGTAAADDSGYTETEN